MDIHPGTARTHASGNCGCETDEDSHPFRAWERQGNAADCSRLRTLVGDGLSVQEAVDELGISGTTGAAGYHVRGDCGCETDVPPRSARATDVDAHDCAMVRKLTDRGKSSTAAEAELELDVARGDSREHARGNCTCETDVPVTPFDATRSVSEADCVHTVRPPPHPEPFCQYTPLFSHMDRIGVGGIVLMAIGATLMFLSTAILLEPLWLVQLAGGLLIFIIGAGMDAVYSIRVLENVLRETSTVRDRSASR